MFRVWLYDAKGNITSYNAPGLTYAYRIGWDGLMMGDSRFKVFANEQGVWTEIYEEVVA